MLEYLWDTAKDALMGMLKVYESDNLQALLSVWAIQMVLPMETETAYMLAVHVASHSVAHLDYIGDIH